MSTIALALCVATAGVAESARLPVKSRVTPDEPKPALPAQLAGALDPEVWAVDWIRDALHTADHAKPIARVPPSVAPNGSTSSVRLDVSTAIRANIRVRKPVTPTKN